MEAFNYDMAFARNLGWITSDELHLLSTKTVAIAGLGGVGGHYCEVLARLGVQNFSIADFDRFDLPNFNRQNGAGVSTLGIPKLDVLKNRILDINPLAQIRCFSEGIAQENLNDFLAGADLYLDGLDFFALTERILVFRRLRELGIPAITVAPVGMGASVLVFTGESMTFEDYFGFDENTPDFEKAIHFLGGIAPSLMHRHYLADPTRANMSTRLLPSTPMGIYLCGGVAGSTALKVLLGRGRVALAPRSYHFDAYLGRLKTMNVMWGAKNPLQRLKRWFIRRSLGLSKDSTQSPFSAGLSRTIK